VTLTPTRPGLQTAPFVFLPAQKTVAGAAYTRPFKALCGAWVLGSGLWLAPLVGASGLNQRTGWFILAWLLMAYSAWYLLRSRTSLSDSQLTQTGWVDKQLPVAELAYCKLLRVPGLDAFIAPRLYARSLSGKFAVFYAADKALLAEFERLCTELTAFRRLP